MTTPAQVHRFPGKPRCPHGCATCMAHLAAEDEAAESEWDAFCGRLKARKEQES
jgi:hypothetical protein